MQTNMQFWWILFEPTEKVSEISRTSYSNMQLDKIDWNLEVSKFCIFQTGKAHPWMIWFLLLFAVKGTDICC
jgi:hypothetical protein